MMSEAEQKARGEKKRTQDDFRSLLHNPLLGDLPAAKRTTSATSPSARDDEDNPADLAPCRNPSNPICFFDVEIGEQAAGRVFFELHSHIVPKTCENFRQLCVGAASRLNPGKKLHYKGSMLHRVIPGFMAQGGDFVNGDGSGGESIEEFTGQLPHRYMLGLLDRYDCPIEYKGGTCDFVGVNR